ncbi:MAG: AAA domain-containing protein [Firmicutes bacterium]|nr:AAA domain-containing protein [Bacillota bacterium]
MDMRLYEVLFKTREKLKIRFFANGRTPTICTDEALRDLARLQPRSRGELEAIKGIGKVFVDKYGDFFLAEINRYLNAGKRVVKLRPEIKRTLRRLEDRLVNISRRNRLLYSARLTAKTAIDLFWDGNESYNMSVAKFLRGEEKTLRLADPSLAREHRAVNERRLKNGVTLMREVERDERETGESDLFIGYPFVMGKTIAEDFTVRAPLLLFPIEVNRRIDSITLRIDTKRDILFNTNLVLLQNKVAGTRHEITNNVYDETTMGYDFVGHIQKYFGEFGIRIEGSLGVGRIDKFTEYKAAEFPKFPAGDFTFENVAVLGKFALHSSAMQRDYRTLGDRNDMGVMLDQLLSGFDENADPFANDDENVECKETACAGFSERDTFYINELNASQENALVKIRDEDALVVHGPPGTGKSQVITSFISDFATRGKNVLMVSQKKTALDVIHSRLGNLSTYSIIMADIRDKENFYRQLVNLFNCDRANPFSNETWGAISSDIENNIERLDTIAQLLYTDSGKGAPMFRIYQENIGNTFRHDQSLDLTPYVKTVSRNDLEKITYPRLRTIFNGFNEPNKLQSATDHHRLLKQFPWLEFLRDGVGRFDRIKMTSEFGEFVTAQEEFLKSNIFKRLFGRGKRKKQLKQIAKPYFAKWDKMFRRPSDIMPSLNAMERFIETRAIYNALESDEREYIAAVVELCDTVTECDCVDRACRGLYDFLVYMVIERFESHNRTVFDNVKNFEFLITRVSEQIADKTTVTKQKLRATLDTAFAEFIATGKRWGEMKRISEMKRKWSINKFIERFGFELFKGVKVWLLTPEVISEILPLENDLFDLLIFDEASQIYIERGIPAVARAKKVVVCGDNKQLRPSALGVGRIDTADDDNIDYEDVNAALEVESLLDLAKTQFADSEVMLNYHYRSRYEELIAFSNAAFYGGRLLVSPNTVIPEKPPIEVIRVKNGTWENRANRAEADHVVKLIREHLETRTNMDTIGVITFNSNQRDLIMDVLDAAMRKDAEFAQLVNTEFARKDEGQDIGLFIKNIENVQGDERDIIIFSFAYAKDKDGRLNRNFGWLNQSGGENRLNVAISRSRKKIIVVTSIDPEDLIVDDLKNDGPRLLRRYLEYTRAVSNRDSDAAALVLSTLNARAAKMAERSLERFERDVAEFLTDKLPTGHTIHTGVGMGSYKIDLAIKNADGQYVLGIELDDKLYVTQPAARERDIHRRKYFTGRGWHIHRLFSNTWWNDRDNETQKILTMVSLYS